MPNVDQPIGAVVDRRGLPVQLGSNSLAWDHRAKHNLEDNLMTLVPHWRRVLLHAWSLWPVYLATLLEVALELFPYVADWLPWWVPILFLVLTPIFRVIKQEKLHAGQSDQE
jgi:hypothetical protein